MRIAIIGLGHVGLPTALSLSSAGWPVVGTDSAGESIRAIAAGRSPFYEPNLDALLRQELAAGRFTVTASLDDAVREADVLFICVNTPQRDDGTADLSNLETVTRTIAANLNGHKLIVEKSTTPVRTIERVRDLLDRHKSGDHRFDVAVNPEFMQEGHAVHDVLHPDRIVLGVDTDRAREMLTAIYRPLLERLPSRGACEQCERRGSGGPGTDRLVVTDLATAELIKHAANAFLAAKISFINMIADLCEAIGADVDRVAHSIGLDPRIGPRFLRAGIGFGGSCLPKDVHAFITIAAEHGVDFGLLDQVVAINRARIDRLLDKLHRMLSSVQGKVVAVLGLAFKPLTDDVREAPSRMVIRRLVAQGAILRLYDPRAMENMRAVVPAVDGRISYCDSPYDAAAGAHALILLTEWEEFRSLDVARLHAVMARPVMIDGRNIFAPAAMRAAGFEYASFGRP